MNLRTMLLAAPLIPLLVAAPGARNASAQSTEAQELFDEGRKALAAKDYATACKKLGASEHVERAVGTLLSLAECEEAVGRLASARLHLQEAASWAEATRDPLNRGPIARERLEAVDKRVPRLTLKLAAGAPKDAHLKCDGVDLGTDAFGSALPVDPGKHVIVVSAAGRADGTFQIDLRENEQESLEVAPGASVAAPVAAPPSVAPAPSAGDEAPVQNAPETAASLEGGPGSSRRTWAWVLGGVGIVGLGAGTFFGVSTLSKWSQAKNDCGAGCPDGSVARSEKSEAQTDATISTVALAFGGVALAAGAYLLFAWRSARAPATSVRVAPWVAAGGGGGAVAVGVW